MEHQASDQDFLSLEGCHKAPFEKPDVDRIHEDCADRFRRALLAGDNSKSGSLLEQLFRFMELRGEATDEEGDALTTNLGGFAINDLPKFTNNECKTLGDIFETLVDIVYSAAFPELYSKNMDELSEKVKAFSKKPGRKGALGKWKPDFLIDLLAKELKYRTGNGQGSTEQARGAKTLRAVGYTPQMQIFRPSPNTSKYENAGWECTEAEETVEAIRKETGVDIIRVIEIVGNDPEISYRRKIYRRGVMAREVSAILFRLKTYGSEMVEANSQEVEEIRHEVNRLL